MNTGGRGALITVKGPIIVFLRRLKECGAHLNEYRIKMSALSHRPGSSTNVSVRQLPDESAQTFLLVQIRHLKYELKNLKIFNCLNCFCTMNKITLNFDSRPRGKGPDCSFFMMTRLSQNAKTSAENSCFFFRALRHRLRVSSLKRVCRRPLCAVTQITDLSERPPPRPTLVASSSPVSHL